jgi:hypothetical protein
MSVDAQDQVIGLQIVSFAGAMACLSGMNSMIVEPGSNSPDPDKRPRLDRAGAFRVKDGTLVLNSSD